MFTSPTFFCPLSRHVTTPHKRALLTGVLALALLLAVSVAALFAPSQAFALAPKAEPLDFTGDTVTLEDGGTVPIPDNAAALSGSPIVDEWDSYGWKLGAREDTEDPAKYKVVLVLANEFTMTMNTTTTSLGVNFGIKLPGADKWSDVSGIYLELVGSASISATGIDSEPAGIKLSGTTTIQKASISSGDTPYLTITMDGDGQGITSGSGTLTIDDVKIDACAQANSSGIGCSSEGIGLVVQNSAEVTAWGANDNCPGVRVARVGSGEDAGGLTVKSGATLSASSEKSEGINVDGALVVGDDPSGSITELRAYGAQGGIACGSVDVRHALVTAYGAASKNATSYTGVAFYSEGNASFDSSVVTAKGITGLWVGDNSPSTLRATNTRFDLLGKVDAAADETVCGLVAVGDITIEDSDLNAVSDTQGNVAMWSAGLSGLKNITLTNTNATLEGKNTPGLISRELLHVEGTSKVAITAAGTGAACFAHHDATFSGDSSTTSTLNGGYANSGLRCAGKILFQDNATLEAKSNGESSVGLMVIPYLDSMPIELNVQGGTLKAHGARAGLLINQSGDRTTEPAPITLGSGVSVRQGGKIASVAGLLTGQEETFWTLSQTGHIGFEEGRVTGASTDIRISDTAPVCYLEVDGTVLVATDAAVDVQDAELPGKATFTAATRTLTLHGAPEMPGDASQLPVVSNIDMRGLAEGVSTGAFTLAFDGVSAVGVLSGQNASAPPASKAVVSVSGPLRIAGADADELVVLGALSTEVDTFGNPGSIVLESGTVTLAASGDTGAVLQTAGNANVCDASVKLAGGSLSVAAMGALSGMSVDGDLDVTGVVSGGMHQVISTGGQGVHLAGSYEQTSGSLTAGGSTALGAKSVVVEDGVLNVLGMSGMALDEQGVGIKSLKALGLDVSAVPAAVSSQDFFGLSVEENVSISGGVVNAFACAQAPGQAGQRAMGIHANNGIEVSDGIVCALADAATSESSTAIGMGVETSGSIALTGGTTTAYAFPAATMRTSMSAGANAVTVGVGMQTAAGDRAPGAQVATGSAFADRPYAYVTTGNLYLTNDQMKWDHLDRSSLMSVVAFDPPNGELKVNKEMMASIVGLNRMTMILSDNVDFSKGTFLDSYNANSMTDYGSLFSGTGAVLLFESGSSLHNVGGVDMYDFGSRYDAQPELVAMRALVPKGDALIHSVHFNYEGELPADTTVIMAVGNSYKNTSVIWGYSDATLKNLTTILAQNTDSLGWFAARGQKALWHETALTSAAKPSPVPKPIPKPLAPTGDGIWGGVGGPLTLIGLLSIVAVVVAARKNGHGVKK